MFLRCFPDGEDLKRIRRIWTLCGDTDAQRNRVGAQRETADGIHMLAQLRASFFHQFPTDLADEASTARIQSGDTRVGGEVALCAGGEGKFAVTNGLFLKQRVQLLLKRGLYQFETIGRQEMVAGAVGRFLTTDLSSSCRGLSAAMPQRCRFQFS